MSELIMYEIKMNKYFNNRNIISDANQFLSLGTFDDVYIDKFDVTQEKGDLSALILKYYKNKIKFINDNPNVLSQSFLIFKKILPNEKEYYNDFFNNNNWNFQFITFVFVNNYNDQYKSFEKAYKEYLSLIDEKMIIFDTFDNCSFISIIRSLSYSEGISKIVKLGYLYNDNYCFTILTLNKRYTDYTIGNGEKETVNLRINVTIKKNEYHEEIEKKKYFSDFEKRYNCGNSDVYFLKTMSVNELYDLFSLFQNNNKNFNDAYFSINSNVAQKAYSITANRDGSDGDEYKISMNKQLDEYFTSIQALNHKYNNTVWIEFIYYLYSLVNNLKQIIAYNYCDLACLTLLPSFNILINKLNNLDYKYITSQLLTDYYHYINDARTIIDLITSSSYHTNHDTFSHIDSNEICGKLVTFYNIFADNITQLFNKNDKLQDQYKYGFLVIPQLFQRIEVQVLNNTSLPEDRLLLVNMPIYQIYNIPLVLITLSHECAHFIGDKIRNRETRKKSLNNIISYYCMEFVFSNYKDKRFEKALYDIKMLFLVIINNKIEDIENKNDVEYLDAYEDIVRNGLIKYFIDNKDIILDTLIDAFEKYIYKMYDSGELKDVSYVDLIEMKKNFDNEITNRYTMLYTDSDYTIKVIMSQVFYMDRECFADLFAINILKLKPEDYFNALVSASKNYSNEELDSKELIRFALISDVKQWELDVKNDFFNKVDKLRNMINNNEENNMNLLILDAYRYQFIWKETVEYLKKSNADFEEKIVTNEFSDIYKVISESEEDLSKIMNMINSKIHNYRTLLIKGN